MLDGLTASLVEFAISVIELFPESPFLILEELSTTEFYDLLRFLNWFIPINTFITIFDTWLVGVALYYAYQVVLRWIKVIE